MKILSSLLLVLSFSLVGCAHHGAKSQSGKKACTSKDGKCDLKKKDCKSGKCKLDKKKSPCCS